MCAYVVVSGHASRSSDLAKTILQGTVRRARTRERQRKRWEDNVRDWTVVAIFPESRRAAEDRDGRAVGYEIVVGAPTTLRVKGQLAR